MRHELVIVTHRVGISGKVILTEDLTPGVKNRFRLYMDQPASGPVCHGAYRYETTARQKAVELAKRPE